VSVLLDRYRALAQLSDRLAESARAQDWPAILETHEQRQRLIAAIGTPDLATLPAAERSAVREMLLAMRDSDATVRNELQEWREQIGQLLHGIAPEKADGTA